MQGLLWRWLASPPHRCGCQWRVRDQSPAKFGFANLRRHIRFAGTGLAPNASSWKFQNNTATTQYLPRKSGWFSISSESTRVQSKLRKGLSYTDKTVYHGFRHHLNWHSLDKSFQNGPVQPGLIAAQQNAGHPYRGKRLENKVWTRPLKKNMIQGENWDLINAVSRGPSFAERLKCRCHLHSIVRPRPKGDLLSGLNPDESVLHIESTFAWYSVKLDNKSPGGWRIKILQLAGRPRKQYLSTHPDPKRLDLL